MAASSQAVGRSTSSRTNRIRVERTRTGGVVHTTQFADARLYEWLRGVGLTPRKSLTLGAIDVPDQYLAPLVRGLLDGDGSIMNFVHEPTRRSYPEYRYERLWVLLSFSERRAHRMVTLAGAPAHRKRWIRRDT